MRTLYLAVAVAATCWQGIIAQAADEPSWALRPYRIEIVTAVSPDGNFPHDFEPRLHAALVAKAAGIVGGAWQVEGRSAAGPLRSRMLRALAEIESAPLLASGKLDKRMLLVIDMADGGYRVRVRELDLATGQWGSLIAVPVKQRANLENEAFNAVLKAFAPLAQVQAVNETEVALWLRAGGIAYRDAKLPVVAPGVVFAPVLVEKDGEQTKRQPVEWTYFVPGKTEGPLVSCTLQSGLKQPVLPDYHPLRQRLALAVVPTQASTELRLTTAGDDAAAVPDCDVFAEAEGSRKHWIARGNAQGVALLPAGDLGLRWISVEQGTQVLARFPLVPGPRTTLRISVSSDARRLQAESRIAQALDDLTDAVGRRQVLAARIRAKLDAQDAAGARQLLGRLRALPGPGELMLALGKLQTELSGDAEAQVRLEKQLRELRRLLKKFKDADPADALAKELDGPAPAIVKGRTPARLGGPTGGASFLPLPFPLPILIRMPQAPSRPGGMPMPVPVPPRAGP